MKRKIEIEFYYGFDHPEEPGRYAILNVFGSISTMMWSEYGWNTSREGDEPIEDEYIYAWSPNLSTVWNDVTPTAYECEDCGHKFDEFDTKSETYVDNHGGEDIVWNEEVKCCPKCGSTNWKEWAV